MIKQLVFSMLAIAGMVSCNSHNDHPYDPSNQTKINLGIGVNEIVSKAAINPQEKNDFTTEDDIYLIRTDIEKGTLLPTLDGVKAVKINSSKKFVLPSEWQFYNGEKETFFTGFYPAGTFHVGTSEKPSWVSFTDVNGEIDIVHALPYSVGTKDTPTPDPVLTFKHILSQIQINVVGTAAGQKGFGKIKQVLIKDIPSSIDLYLNDKENIDVKITDNSPDTHVIVYEDAEGMIIPTTPTKIGVIPMIFNGGEKPYGTSDNPLVITVTTEYEGEKIIDIINIGAPSETATGLEMGKKHVITLTFKDKIIVSADITPWDPNGNTGGGDVE
ncbi:fimbrillin family protein [Parabacteroides sp. APC149_11_2_Y6]